MEKKYELIPSDIEGLFRIKALRGFGDVEVGDVGGYVASEYNLSHDGDAWVSGYARVYEDAQVSGYARVYGNARVSELTTKTPTVISGLYYLVTITDNHLRAGCQCWTFEEWRSFDEAIIRRMDVGKAWDFYNETLIPLMDALKLGVSHD